MTGHIINNDFMSGNHNDMKDFSKLNSFTEQYNFQFCRHQQHIYQYHKSNLRD